ncbi:FMN-dependent NADH-azoreductase [Roseospira navarrensis]|uniref:FMN dependent NADH:quinone oxidoreductase n=1 Tax=Roseospira navarrensis TaxID=140058 RepID=A0A7X1ZBI5_9PROT|nr:NAD(P)H-dependent oxidoreductase [Roseospira navarrensis]MQX35488.1 FMN-dependent NADH-azoreductase [Roseospira navarrensis]
MTRATPLSVLRIDASARTTGSVTRDLTDHVMQALGETGPLDITVRDLAATPPPLLDEAWIHANFTDPAERSAEARAALAVSDTLVAELKAADVIVIGLPVYNFAPPAVLKAWVDMVARARETFRYTAEGPEGLLTGKRAILAMASGGTETGSAIDFASPYLRHILGFMGITDVSVVAADRHMTAQDDRIAAARATVGDALASLRLDDAA